ncbi:MAG: hypothetical protein JXC36_06310, partial [Candidatus Atribacteria bacterium]|nr:hypothetical protein [Candidatus Atribacteria bacterium]
MRCKKITTFFIFLVIAFILLITSIHVLTVNAFNEDKHIIQTYGQSELTVKPDSATVSLSIETN